MGLISDIFTWWNGPTLSTRLYTKKYGKFAGEDERGNRYYEDSRGIGPAGKPRRWVIYNGYAEASTYRRIGSAGCTTQPIRPPKRKPIT